MSIYILHEASRIRAKLGIWLDRALSTPLARAGVPPRRVLCVTLDVLPPDPASLAILDRARRDGRPIDIALGRSVFLRKLVNLPAAARRDAAGAVGVQVRQNLPAGAQGMVWRFRPTNASGGRAEYEVLILKQDSLAEVLRTCGVEPRLVTIADGDGFRPLIDNRAQADRPQWFWNRAAVGSVLLALLAVLGTQAWRLAELDIAEAALRARVATLAEQAAAARATADARDSAEAARTQDISRLVGETGRLAELADISRTLDDDVWISSLEVAGATWELVGFAHSDVSAVVSDLQDVPWVAAVAAGGSVVLDPITGESRFQLVLQAHEATRTE